MVPTPVPGSPTFNLFDVVNELMNNISSSNKCEPRTLKFSSAASDDWSFADKLCFNTLALGVLAFNTVPELGSLTWPTTEKEPTLDTDLTI